MISVENVEGEYSSQSLEGGGVPPYVQKLAVLLSPLRIFCAHTKLYVDVVNSIGVDHDNYTSFGA